MCGRYPSEQRLIQPTVTLWLPWAFTRTLPLCQSHGKGLFNKYVDINLPFFDLPTYLPTLLRVNFILNVDSNAYLMDHLPTSSCPWSYFLGIFIKKIKNKSILFLLIFRAYPTDGEGFSLWFYVKSWFIEKKITFKHVLYESVPSDDPPPAKLPLMMLLDFFSTKTKQKRKKWKSSPVRIFSKYES